MSLEKQLADTDSVYCTKTTSSNQTSIFIGNLGDIELDVLFGTDYKSDDEVRLHLDKRNLAFNAVSHVLDGKNWFKRKSSEKWAINSEWLNARIATLKDVFSGNQDVFVARLNKDENSTHRLYLKGMSSLSREDGNKSIALRDFLFSGDVIVLTKLDNGDLGFEVKIPDNSLISLPSPAISIASLLASELEKDRLLDAALKLFAAKRSELLAVGEKNYDECYAEVRAEAARINGDYLVSCDYEAFRNTLNARQVANSFFSRHTDDDKRRLGDFIAAVRQDPRDISFYLVPGNQPNVPGIGPAMLTAFLTRTRPDLFVFFTEQMFESVKFLGLTAEDALPALSTDAYNTYRGIQTAIRDRMREMEIKAENGNDADYLTVNEFTWFVSENQDLIKEEVMKKQWKPVNSSAAKKSGTRTLADAFANDEMLKRLAAALRTKPFAILAGHSGTGKSQLVRRLAYMTCNNEFLAKEGEGKTAPGNYCMVQVKPNWHDSSDLLGYYSEMGGRHFVNTPFVQFVCKAYAYPNTPFFVCLDEMNLAPVEQYFAEYLSAIESLEKEGADWVTDPLVEVDKDGATIDPEILGQIMKGAESTEAAEWIQAHGLTIPKNLFVIGTVNMDETTCQFSRKVLDRAMTLLMNTVSFADMATGRKPSDEKLLDDDGVKFLLEGDVRGEVGSIESGLLDGINEPLKNTAFVVAYRFANEYALYEAAWAKLRGIDLATAAEEDKKQLASEALDQVVLMKLLPRIHGEKAAVKAIFEGGKRDGKETPGLKGRLPAGGLSVGMMDDILARGDEYLTFWP